MMTYDNALDVISIIAQMIEDKAINVMPVSLEESGACRIYRNLLLLVLFDQVAMEEYPELMEETYILRSMAMEEIFCNINKSVKQVWHEIVPHNTSD